jgi:hypothetical protein
MTFNEFKKELKGIKYRSKKDWEIFLPYDTKRETLQIVIDKCREHLLLDWHIYYKDETEEDKTPDIEISWNRKDLTSTE